MKRWFRMRDLNKGDFQMFLNKHGLKPGEVIVISFYENFAGSGIEFLYYSEEEKPHPRI